MPLGIVEGRGGDEAKASAVMPPMVVDLARRMGYGYGFGFCAMSAIGETVEERGRERSRERRERGEMSRERRGEGVKVGECAGEGRRQTTLLMQQLHVLVTRPSQEGSVMPVVGSQFVSSAHAGRNASAADSPCRTLTSQAEAAEGRLSLINCWHASAAAGDHEGCWQCVECAGPVQIGRRRGRGNLDKSRFALRTRAAEASRLAILAADLWPSPGLVLTRHSSGCGTQVKC